MTPAEVVRAAAAEIGFDAVAFTAASPAESDGAFLSDWVGAGKAAGMGWLGRDPARRARPTSLLPEARTLITLGVSYYEEEPTPPPAGPAGRVARYAWGEDYHAVIEWRLEELRDRLRLAFGPGVISRPAVDIQPLLERAFARRAGLGFVGKNTNLIRPGGGSFLFLADLLVNLELPPDGAVPQGCGACTRCQDACPTGALDTPFELDARLCVAYHTIENRGAIPRELRPRMGRWVFGCDDCQDVCPFNARAAARRWPEFSSRRGPGPWLGLADLLRLDSDEAFRVRFRGTSILRAKRAGLVRNACVASANGGAAERLADLLDERLRRDTDPVVREHAAWALGRAGRAGRDRLGRAWAAEEHPAVKEEIDRSLREAA